MTPSPRPLAEIEVGTLERLDAAWSPARAAGAVGSSSVEALRLHASGFILEEWRELPAGAFVDCGTGAGIPGILLALELPKSRWTLVDAKVRRCELAQTAVIAAGLVHRARVQHGLVEDLAKLAEYRGSFDGAVARSFGPASELAECGLPLLKLGGTLVVSVSPITRQRWWRMALAERTGCEIADYWTTPCGEFLSVRRVGPIPAGAPRRRPARQRSPL